MRRLALAASLSLLAATAVASAPARADEPTEAELAVARDRFREGLALEEAGDFRAARAKFELVAETRTSPQVLYHLARCDEELGSLVGAIDGYRRAIAAAEQAGDAAAAVIEEARPRLAAVEERVPKLRVAIDGELAAGDQVTVDGAPREAWSEELAVDPGRRVVAVVRDGAPLAEVAVEAVAGERATARIALPVLEGDPAPPPAPPPPPDEGGGGPPVAALVVGGVGAASVVVGGVTFAMQQMAIDDVRSSCADPDAGTGCDPRTRAREDDAHTLGVTSAVLIGVGAACLVTGVVLWITSDDAPGQPPSARTGVALAPGPLGAAAVGRF